MKESVLSFEEEPTHLG